MKAFFLVNSANITASLDGYVRQGKFLKPTTSLRNMGGHLELDEGYISSVLDNSGMHGPGTKGSGDNRQQGRRNSNSNTWRNNLTRTATETFARQLDCTSI